MPASNPPSQSRPSSIPPDRPPGVDATSRAAAKSDRFDRFEIAISMEEILADLQYGER